MLSGHRDERSQRFFKQAIDANGFLTKSSWIKRHQYTVLKYQHAVDVSRLIRVISFIEICQVEYLNNLIEQDHRS